MCCLTKKLDIHSVCHFNLKSLFFFFQNIHHDIHWQLGQLMFICWNFTDCPLNTLHQMPLFNDRKRNQQEFSSHWINITNFRWHKKMRGTSWTRVICWEFRNHTEVHMDSYKVHFSHLRHNKLCHTTCQLPIIKDRKTSLCISFDNKL